MSPIDQPCEAKPITNGTEAESTTSPGSAAHTVPDESSGNSQPSSQTEPIAASEEVVVQSGDAAATNDVQDPGQQLEDFDWVSLMGRYHHAMEKCSQDEEAMFQDFSRWIRIFEAWASTTTVHENDRSYKRLRTRISYVQMGEDRLEKKRELYISVVKAFESALALLGST